MPRYTKAEREESLAELRRLLRPGDKVSCIIRHVSRSGMRRVITPILFKRNEPHYLSYHAARVLDWGEDRREGGVKVDGCGMDMCFHLVYCLARSIFTKKQAQRYLEKKHGKNCKWHSLTDPGYLLDHRTI
jgi:hypothetical protein